MNCKVNVENDTVETVGWNVARKSVAVDRGSGESAGMKNLGMSDPVQAGIASYTGCRRSQHLSVNVGHMQGEVPFWQYRSMGWPYHPKIASDGVNAARSGPIINKDFSPLGSPRKVTRTC